MLGARSFLITTPGPGPAGRFVRAQREASASSGGNRGVIKRSHHNCLRAHSNAFSTETGSLLRSSHREHSWVCAVASQGWVLSDRDYPEGELILGIEIRSHSIKAAPVDTANAEFQRPGVSVPIEDFSEETLREALGKIATHFQWKGPVGISYTRLAVRALGGVQKGEHILSTVIPEWKGRVATMIHTEAAAYAEMYFGPGREQAGIVLVCTLGKGFGAVLYERGQKVRSKDFKHLTWTYERELIKLQKVWGWTGVVPPLPASEGIIRRVEDYGLNGRGWWLEDIKPSEEPCAETDAVLAWASLVDRYLQKIASSVTPERLILLPTGTATDMHEELFLKLFRPGVQLAGLNEDVLVMGEFPDRALVKGAAVGAHIELQSKAASGILRDAICQTVTESEILRPLSEEQMAWVFKKLDANKDGEICENDLITGARFFGTPLSIAEIHGVMKELHCGLSGAITKEQLSRWWSSEVSHSIVTQISSAVELQDALDSAKAATECTTDAGGQLVASKAEDKVVVVEAGFSYCRPCKKFESSYEIIARNHPDVSFLKVVGDSTPAAAHLCKDVLAVQSTPDFRIYKGEVLICQFTGANKTRLEEAIAMALKA